MKNTKIKYPVILVICCLLVTLGSCASRSFRAKKHQRSNFLGEKKKQESFQSFNSNESIKINVLDYRNNDADISFNATKINQ